MYQKIPSVEAAAEAFKEQQMHDFAHFTTTHSQEPMFDFNGLETADFDTFLMDPPADLTQNVSLPTMWGDWEFENYGNPGGSSSSLQYMT